MQDVYDLDCDALLAGVMASSPASRDWTSKACGACSVVKAPDLVRAPYLNEGDASDSELDAERYADLASTEDESIPDSPTASGSGTLYVTCLGQRVFHNAPLSIKVPRQAADWQDCFLLRTPLSA